MQKLIIKLSYDFDADVQLFEINIRSLASLLCAYQMDGDVGFLKLAKDLANRLLPAFDSPTGMPYRHVNLTSGVTKDPHSNPAEIGTYLLEWGTLSKETGNPVYYQKAKRAAQAVFDRRSDFGLVVHRPSIALRINVLRGVGRRWPLDHLTSIATRNVC